MNVPEPESLTEVTSRKAHGAPLRLGHLTWADALAALRRDPRIILPVGSCLQHGPHLPLATDSLVITRIAEEVSARHQVLLAPTLPYGVASEAEREYAGTASLNEKTLHRALNELVSCWERHGMTQIVLMTAHGYGPHLRALSTVISETVRVRAVDLHAIDLSAFPGAPLAAQHAGELATSLMLYLEPRLVRTEHIRDAALPDAEVRKITRSEEPVPVRGSEGVVGQPSLASAELGRDIYGFLVDHIARRLFGGDGDTD